MKRQENQTARPTAGCLSVPLFNQKKRSRVPLTSAPSENEFFSHSEYPAGASTASSHNASGNYGCYQAPGASSGPPQNLQWNRPAVPEQTPPPQQYVNNRPAPGPAPGPAPAKRNHVPVPHPYKFVTASQAGQPGNPMRQQDSSPGVSSRQGGYRAPPRAADSPQSRPAPPTGLSSPYGQNSSSRPPNPPRQYSQQPAPPPSTPPNTHNNNNSWKFNNSFGPQKSPFDGNRSANRPQTPRHSQPEASPGKPAVENSLRILTSVIDGMRHWSQFKDKVPYLFEIFATLDSAVTLGRHGAKNFVLREGKEVLQCVFYENEQELPRLIRGQVHRCVGNYDRSRDLLMCVSIRPALPSEQRNAQEAVKACDAEMRALVKSISEV